MSQKLQDLAQSLVARTFGVSVSGDVEGVGVIDIASILATALALLPMLPCFKKAETPAEKRQLVEDRPELAISRTAQKIRQEARGQGERIIRKESKRLAEQIVNDYLSSTDDEVASYGITL